MRDEGRPPLAALVLLFARVGNLTFGGGDAITAMLQRELNFVDWAPTVFVSAVSGQRTGRILELARDIQAERDRRPCSSVSRSSSSSSSSGILRRSSSMSLARCSRG